MKLMVIGEVDVLNAAANETRNRSLNKIVEKYLMAFPSVLYFGPGSKFDTSTIADFGLSMVSTDAYSKRAFKRVQYLLSNTIYGQLDEIIEKYQPDWVQIRVPSVFALKCGLYISSKHDIKIAAYVAGDWLESLQGNYNSRVVSLIGRAFNTSQLKLLRKSVVVTAGDVLKNNLSNVCDCYAYYSTTHDAVYYNSVRQKHILVVGRLENLKRPHIPLLCLARLNERVGPSFRLTFLGDGPEKQMLLDMADRLGLGSQVVIHGYESNGEIIRQLYLNSKYLIHASETEGTSKVLSEAMAHGVVPLAIRDVGSNNYILEHCSNRLVDACDIKISEAILEFEEDASKYNEVVAKGYSYAVAHTLTEEVENMWDWCFGKLKP